MESLVQVTIEILRGLPLVLHPGVSPFFWPVLFLVFMQYRRIAAMEDSIHGHVLNPPLRRLLGALAYGAVAGGVGSLILVMLGVSLKQQDVMFLLPVALLLMLIHPRLLCFSYAGGIVSVSHLLLGWPDVNVAAIMALVAVLHLVEGILVMWGGDTCRTPVFIQTPGGVVGGFSMQRFWPLPLIVLVLLQLDPDAVGQVIDMPNWWPLVSPRADSIAGPGWVNVMLPVTAALGYADLALTSLPAQRARITGRHLLIYSMLLFVVSVLASRIESLLWAAALLGPGAHELMINRGSRAELEGRPVFVPPANGVMILDRIEGLPAHLMGLGPGDVILAVDGVAVESAADLLQRLSLSAQRLDLELVRGCQSLRVSHQWDSVDARRLGVILVPEPGAVANVSTSMSSPLARLLSRLRARRRHRYDG